MPASTEYSAGQLVSKGLAGRDSSEDKQYSTAYRKGRTGPLTLLNIVRVLELLQSICKKTTTQVGDYFCPVPKDP